MMRDVGQPFEEYLRGWDERRQLREERASARAGTAREVAERLAQLLQDRFGATRVWLVGSLVVPAWFHDRSDIDLACAGIPQDRVTDADLAIWQEAQGFGVDLLPVEGLSAERRRRIEREGILLVG
jgi:predicted nucleotidyltransferase